MMMSFEARLVQELGGVFRNLWDENLPEMLMQTVARLMDAERAALIVSDGSVLADGHRHLELQYTSHPPEHLELSRSVVEEAMSSPNGVARRNQEANPSVSMGQHGIHSCIAVCIRTDEGILGAIYCDVRRSHREFDKTDDRNLATLGDFLVPVLLHLRLREAEVLHSGGRIGRPELIGDSEVMRRLKEDVRKLAALPQSVMITGPTGCGKELVAGLLHLSSGRPGRYVAVNSAEFPEGVLASELFGHQKGAFTGATMSRTGLIVAADRGTLFLDEIGNASRDLQAKLLRVLETREVRPVGSDGDPVRVDVRFIFATNRDPQELVATKSMLPDLYFRMAPVTLHVPPLNQRREDIPLLALHYAAPRTLEPVAMQMLIDLDWPGNVRQLKNVCELARDLASSPRITASDLQAALRYSTRRDSALSVVERVERGDLNFFRLKALVEEGEISMKELEAALRSLYQIAGETWAGVGRKLGLHGREELKRFDNYIGSLRRRHGLL